MKTQLSKNALFHYFAGRSTPLQKKVIEEWLSNPLHVEQYYEWIEEWEREHPQFIPDTEKALSAFTERMHTQDGPVMESPEVATVTSASRFRWTAYAATVAILFTLGAYLGRNLIRYRQYDTAYGEVRAVTLEDGSKVFLNAHSSLKVPRFGFGTETRRVFLEGEAEFSVVHTKDDQKFLVNTPDGLEVEVLGTQFIVYSRDRGSKVVLNEGKVVLRSLADTSRQALAIKPGDVVTIHEGIFDLKQKQSVEAHRAWKERRFVFDHTSLQEIAIQVEENFGLHMQITNDTLAQRELTGTYEAASADDLLDVLARVLDIDVKQSGKNVTVYPR
jgi:ferric-dicitrate binding protein FerR (iron transport regulator)